jgi:hypothetical protein
MSEYGKPYLLIKLIIYSTLQYLHIGDHIT